MKLQSCGARGFYNRSKLAGHAGGSFLAVYGLPRGSDFNAAVRGKLRQWKEKLARQYRVFERAYQDKARLSPVEDLCAIMNSAVTSEFLRPLMAYGKDERHIHKNVWQLAIPAYDSKNAMHASL